MKKGGVSYYGLNEIDKRINEAFEKTKMTPYQKRKLKKQNELINKIGKGLDIHKAILKVAPKKGFVMPGHRYTGPGNQVKCKNDVDRKMVKALDAIPWKERQWGHEIARNAIAAKSKLGMGVKNQKTGKAVE